jgi:hypothetical protein
MRRALGVLFVMLLMMVATGAWFWHNLRAAPEWYAPPPADDIEVEVLAEQVEYGLVEQFHKIRPEGDEWTLRVRENQINAWLSARMPEWIAFQEKMDWPDELGVPQVRVDQEGIQLAVEVNLEGTRQVVTTRVDPRVSQGRLRLELDRVGLGRVALPGAATDRLMELLDDVAVDGKFLGDSGLGAILQGEGSLASGLSLSDGRVVELLNVHCVDGAIDLTSLTRAASAYGQ